MQPEHAPKRPIDLKDPGITPQEVFSALMGTTVGTVEILKHRLIEIACSTTVQTQGDVLQALDTASKAIELSFKGVSDMKQQVEFVWLAQSMTEQLDQQYADIARKEFKAVMETDSKGSED